VNTIPDKLPLLTYLEKSFDIKNKQQFKGYACVFIQHLLGSNIPLIKSIERGGVNKKDFYIIGKAYSTNDEVLKYLEMNKYNSFNPIEGYSTDVCYDDILKNTIRKVFKLVLNHSELPILLLDDAAKGISIAHEDEFKKHLYRFKCVELTSRGINEINRIKLGCPVINVATSDAKKKIEAPLIGKSMVSELCNLLNSWSQYYRPPNRNALLIGYGAIGKAVCTQLSIAGFKVIVFDIDAQQINSATNDNYATTDDISREITAGIVIGCTGTSLIKFDRFSNFQDGTLFVNMASSDLEFGLWKFSGDKSIFLQSGIHKIEDVTLLNEKSRAATWRCLYKITNKDKSFYLANGGFPVNFSGEMDPILPLEIQITRSLVLAAALQVVNEQEHRLITLNEKLQKVLVHQFIKNHNLTA